MFFLCRRSCRPLPSWCLWWSASLDPSTSASSSLKLKIKHFWTSARALLRSTKSPMFLPQAKKWNWCYPWSLQWTEKLKMSQRWKAPFKNLIIVEKQSWIWRYLLFLIYFFISIIINTFQIYVFMFCIIYIIDYNWLLVLLVVNILHGTDC